MEGFIKVCNIDGIYYPILHDDFFDVTLPLQICESCNKLYVRNVWIRCILCTSVNISTFVKIIINIFVRIVKETKRRKT